MIRYDDYALQLLEREIAYIYSSDVTGYPEREYLLELRKRLLENQALDHQAELLPDIIAFNDALRAALKQMYDRAHEVYAQAVSINPDIELSAKCYLNWEYPTLHPYQTEDRQDLWSALQDSGWNRPYDDGIGFALVLPDRDNQSFESFIGMNCPPPNWNEGLDRELTNDLHLIQQFHHLFDHTNFALTDFIFVREFNIEININFEEKVKQPK